MAARPCPVQLSGCPGVDAPVTNVSAEAPDPLLFAGIVWDNYDPHAPPPLGDGPHVRTDCASLQSTIASYDPIIYATTQLMANLQALAISLGCDWPPSGDQTFTNDEQTATVYCPEGTAFTYTVAAGTVVSPPMDSELGAAFVAWANAWASAYAYQQASALMDCVAPDPDTPPEPGPRKPTIPAGAGILPGPVWMCLGEEIFHRYTVSGRGASSYDITISDGALPPGTTFVQDRARSGYITGTPTTPGEYNFTIQAVSTTVPSLTLTVQDYIFVMGITNCDALPDAQTGTAYGPETILATGGTAPYTFASSNLPTGFSLTSAGVLTSDTTTVFGDYTFDVTITDANAGECTQTCSISVAGCVFACLPEKNISLDAFTAPNVCATDEVGGKVFAAQNIVGSAGTVNRLNTSSTAIEASSVVDAAVGISDMVYHPSSGLIYIATTTGLAGNIYAMNPVSMAVVGSAAHSLGTVRLAVDNENDRIIIGGQEPPASFTWVVKVLDINSMTITDVASGDTGGQAWVAYIPSTSALGQGTGLIAAAAFANQLTLYKASDFSLWGTLTLSNNIAGMAGGFDPVLDGALVFSYLSGGVFRIRALEVTPGFGDFTTAPFNAPAIGSTIQISIGTTTGLALVPTIFIGGTQWELESIDSGTQVTVKNLSVVMGTLIAGGTFFFGSGVFDAFLYTSQATAASVSYSSTASAFIVATDAHAVVLNRDTHLAVCTLTPSIAASTNPTRCDISGACNLVLPWNVGPVNDFYKVF